MYARKQNESIIMEQLEPGLIKADIMLANKILSVDITTNFRGANFREKHIFDSNTLYRRPN